MEQSLRAARASLRDVRRVVWSLRPETLERGSLEQALDRLASDLSKQTEISAHTVVILALEVLRANPLGSRSRAVAQLGRPALPNELIQIERAIASAPVSARETYHRLCPILMEIAADRLEIRRRIDLDVEQRPFSGSPGAPPTPSQVAALCADDPNTAALDARSPET